MARRSWAVGLVEDCTEMSALAQKQFDEIDVIIRARVVAVSNVENHVRGLDVKYQEKLVWAVDELGYQESLLSDSKSALQHLRAGTVTPHMIQFILGQGVKGTEVDVSLENLIDVAEVTKAEKSARNAATKFKESCEHLTEIVDRVMNTSDSLFLKVNESPAHLAAEGRNQSIDLLADIEATASKISTDYEHILSLPDKSSSAAQASKTASLHTKNYLPILRKRSLEMYGIMKEAITARNQASSESVDDMQAVSSLTAMLTEALKRLDKLQITREGCDAFDLLSLVERLPAIYASFLAEAVKRREWNEKVKIDSSTLANEMATFQDEEERRRKKWQKNTGTQLWPERSEVKALGVEVNLQGKEEAWPNITRQDLVEFLHIMQEEHIRVEIIDQIAVIIKEMSNPTKQQAKRAKAFKNGSIHEAGLGKSALLVRGDDDLISALQEEKLKVEAKLKSAESRVRRLEDLLHRQGHMSRGSIADVFQLPGSITPDRADSVNPMASPRINDDLSRPSSVASRRFSSNHGPDERAFSQRIIALEAELIAERERVLGLEKETAARSKTADALKAQVEDANSTKRDLMENMEAQQYDFIQERKSLEAEIKKMKTKLEEVEDELDRILGSRENDKVTVDHQIQRLQEEVEKTRKEDAAEIERAQGQVDFLRNDSKLQRESNENLQRLLERSNDEKKDLKARLAKLEHNQSQHVRSLSEVHDRLSPSSELPSELSAVVDAVVTMANDLLIELENHKRDLAIGKSNLHEAQSTLTDMKNEMSATQEKLGNEEMESFRLREALGSERAKHKALEAEMEEERKQLSTLRAKFADGQNGSESLRSRVEEEERRASHLSEELAAKRSEVGSLEEELRSSQARTYVSQSNAESLAARFDARTHHAKDLTQRLYTQNDSLNRLLERLSYSVTMQGGSAIITRIPKVERSSANDSSDAGGTLRRSISGGATIQNAMADSGNLELLRWVQASNIEAEAEGYSAFLNAVGHFDMDAFIETVLRHINELSSSARKYRRDARSYREKSHNAQKEAHEKIAYKSFKEGDLALFLPTRNQATRPWAAFNVGAPHYFLREQDSHKLRTRDWLVARIHKVEERVVDLSKSMNGMSLSVSDRRSIGETSTGGDSFDDDNPFELSDGLRWYLIDAAEEKPGAPSTPGLGKSTVASAHIDATGSIRRSKKNTSAVEGVSKTLSKSLDSRRSSSNSKKGLPAAGRTPSKTSLNESKLAAPTEQTAVAPAGDAVSGEQDAVGLGISRLATTTAVPPGSGGASQEVRSSRVDELFGP